MADIQGLLQKYKQIPGERFFKEIFEGGEYAPVLNRKADTVIDVGALAGEFCTYIYDKAQVIYAIEPHKPHYKELVKNIVDFKLSDKVGVYKLAISDTNGFGFLNNDSGRGSKALTLVPSKEIVRTMTLAEFMKDYKIDHVDILKIDIEGGEYTVFSAPDFKNVASKIDYIIGEHLGDCAGIFTGLGFKQLDKYEASYQFERTK